MLNASVVEDSEYVDAGMHVNQKIDGGAHKCYVLIDDNIITAWVVNLRPSIDYVIVGSFPLCVLTVFVYLNLQNKK